MYRFVYILDYWLYVYVGYIHSNFRNTLYVWSMCVCAVNWVLGWIIPRSCCVLLKDCQSAGKSSGPTWQRFGVQSRFFGTTISQLGPKTAMSWWGSLKWREVPGSWMLFQRTYGGFTHILSPKCSVLLNFGSAPHALWILNCVFLLGPRTKGWLFQICFFYFQICFFSLKLQASSPFACLNPISTCGRQV